MRMLSSLRRESFGSQFGSPRLSFDTLCKSNSDRCKRKFILDPWKLESGIDGSQSSINQRHQEVINRISTEATSEKWESSSKQTPWLDFNKSDGLNAMDDSQRIVKCGNLSLHSAGGFFKVIIHISPNGNRVDDLVEALN